MSAIGLSIVVVGLIAGVGLITLLFSETASAASPSGRPHSYKPPSYSKRMILRCMPKIIEKCPKGERPVCIRFSGRCCQKFVCKSRRD